MPCIIERREKRYRAGGFLVCFLAAATVGLGIADVVTNNLQCTQNNNCTPMTTGLVLTWVSVGIWASIPIFITGLSYIHYSREAAEKDTQKHGWLTVLTFMSALFFTPAIIAISIAEVYFKFYQVGVPTPQWPAVSQAMFGLPVAMAVIAFVIHLFTLHVLLAVCCCSQRKKQPQVASPCPPAPPRTGSAEDGNNADVDRMNIWSAYRWMNVGPSCDRGCGPKPAMPGYYSGAGGAPPSRCFQVGQMSAANSCCHGSSPPPQCSAGIYQYPRPMLNTPAPAGGPAVRW